MSRHIWAEYDVSAIADYLRPYIAFGQVRVEDYVTDDYEREVYFSRVDREVHMVELMLFRHDVLTSRYAEIVSWCALVVID